MKAVRMILRAALWIGIGLALLVTALVMLLYSPWAQEQMRQAALKMVNSQPGTELRLDKLSLRLPMRLNVEGLMMAQGGDTLVAVSKAEANVSLLPLLIGEVGVNHLSVNDLHYQMGNADSLMMMVIKADTVDIKPATVRLSPMKLAIDDGRLSHAVVSLVMKPDTVTAPKSENQMDMSIDITRLRLDDFTYRMSMQPMIDSLGATIGQGELLDGRIDLKGQTITLKDFTGSRLQAAYIAAPATEAAEPEPAPVDTAQTAPWTIKIDNIDFSQSQALYTTRGYVPQPGLDFGYIQVSDLSLQVKDFYNQQADITLPLKLHGTERCGVTLDATGTFAMADGKMLFENFDIATGASALKANGFMGIGDMASAPVALSASGSLGMADVRLMFPIAKPYLLGFKDDAIDLRLGLSGSMADLGIDTAEIGINRVVKMRAHGRIANMMEPNLLSGRLDIDGSVGNANSAFAPLLAGTGMAIPPLTLDGRVLMDRGAIDGKLTAATMQGTLALDAKYNGNVESYDIKLKTNKFPVQAFMPKMGVGRVTANVNAKGHGFDLFSDKTTADVSVDAPQVEYGGYEYTGITMDAHLSGGDGKVNAAVKTRDVDVNLAAAGNLSGQTYDWTASLNGEHIDLKAIKITEDKADLALSLDAKASLSSDFKDMQATATLRDLTFDTPTSTYALSDVLAHFATSDTLTSFLLTNRDLHARAELPHSLDSIMVRVGKLTALLDQQMAERQLHVDTLQKVMPRFAFDLEAGSNNLINDILKEKMMQVGRVSLTADNDSTLSLRGQAMQITRGDMRIDTAALAITQRADRLNLIFTVDNRPGNLDEFAHLRLNGIFNTNQLALRASQKNSQGATGYDLGAIVALQADSTVNARVFPLSPTIGYKPWQVNFDNYITYHIPTKRIDANLRMTGEKSSLALYTEPSADSTYNDVVLKIDDLRLQDWLAINPFAPEISGDLSADVRLGWAGGNDIKGNGTIELADLYYNRERVGTFGIDMDVSTNTAGMVRAKADLTVDGVKTATIAGNLNDSTTLSPFNLDFSLIKFPLAVANPFLPEGTGRLTGTLNGEMLISGNSGQPILNGEIYFENAALKLDMTNTSYAFSEVHIPVKDNLVQFNDFAVMGANENPLRLNGQVDLKSVSSPTFDLNLNAKNMMVVNTRSASHGASLYGKGYIDLDATAKGNMRFMSVKANLAVLSGTNVTYNLSFNQSAMQSPAETDMVKFVNFTDTAMVARADSIAQEKMTMMLNAQLTIQSGVTVVVDLPTSARDKVQVQPQGTVNYTQMPLGDGRLTGRIDINSGFARYTLPVVGSEKEFTIDPESYIAFNGDMLNPILNLKAVDEVRANVTQTGQNSRLIDFDIILDVTGTLETMNVKFDLETNDDLTVANELQSMTAEQRANQAMNLLLYNMYTGPGTKGSANLGGNPLFSFLESQVNNWAANNIKGVDLQFGIDQYNQTTNGATSQTMTYSYQVSKTLFNDRFKIVVGGNYSSNADAEENLSQNLINDISFEYYLNDKQTMLVKLFRHTGYESILEGEITQTGVGFVYRRKIGHLSQVLPKFMRPKRFRKVK